MSTDRFVTFAYGSNMSVARLRERCPSARAIGIAELPCHELRWHKQSKDGSGKCDIIAVDAPNASVFGVLYEIMVEEKPALDLAEGLNKGYDADSSLRPYTWYRALVIAGAKEHGLPASYIAGLKSVLADQDSNHSRHDRNMVLIEGGQA